jgi:hypothetical protein
MAEKKSLVPKENNPKLRAEVERIKKKEALKKSLKKLPGPLGKIIGMTANQIADKYTGKTMFRLFGELQNKKKIFGDKFEEVKKKLAKAKKLRTQQIEMGEVSDRLSEDLVKLKKCNLVVELVHLEVLELLYEVLERGTNNG